MKWLINIQLISELIRITKNASTENAEFMNQKLLISFLCLLFFSAKSFSQDLNLIKGVVLNNEKDKGLTAIVVKNLSTKQKTLTDNKGFFKISSKIGDSLSISKLDHRTQIYVLEKSDLSNNLLILKYSFSRIELDELVINKYKNINAVSLGIIPKKIKTPSPYERRLYTAGDFKLIDLLSLLGGSLEIDPIINKISGRTKRIKKHIETEKKIKSIAFLKKNYSDYLIKRLNLTNEDVDKFLYYLVEETAIQALLDEGNDGRIKFFICDFWYKMQNK